MRQFSCVGVCFAVILACVGGVTAQGTVINYASVNSADVLEYWTPERMANARPAIMALEGQPTPPYEDPAAEPRIPGAIKGGLGGEILLEADEATLVGLAHAVESPGGYTYPPPENTWPLPVPWYGSFPLRAVGKVFYTQGGGNWVASGSSAGGRSVLTAGHVVSDGAGSFSTNMTFVPALRNTWRPFGTWVGDGWMIVATAWHSGGDFCRDVGFFTLNTLGGLTLSARVGWLGFAWDGSSEKAWSGFSYPAAAPWVGSIMVVTNASLSRTDSPGGCTPATMGMGTRQTPGCSGGPWVWGFRAQSSANNYANGVFSYRYVGSELEFFSPYFDTFVKTALRDVAIAQ